MKWFSYLLSLPVFVAPIPIGSPVTVHAQGVERCIEGQDAAPQVVPSVRLIAALIPVDLGSGVNGKISFGLPGEAHEVFGHVDGLDPNKNYRLCVASTAKKNRGLGDQGGGPGDGAIASVQPFHTGTDDAPCVLLPDASGGIEIKTTRKGVGLANGNQSVLGKILILTEVPEEADSGAPLRIASATVTVAESGIDPIHPSRLDELGPDERWF